jgi:2-phosphoglycerate kinase
MRKTDIIDSNSLDTSLDAPIATDLLAGYYMAKILIEDEEENTRVPFLRGILIRSLQDAGLPFKDAYDLATEIRNELGDAEHITTHELRRKVVELLSARSGDQVSTRYRKKSKNFTMQVEQRDGQLTPFYRLEYQNTLETIGLTTEEATEIVATVHQKLLDQRLEVITSRRLGELTYRHLMQSDGLGPAVAHRWLVWRDFVNSGRPLIFLIGGTAGCGKSTIATILASRLDIVRTQSTDMLREVMRTMLPRQLLPVLHTSSFTAWTALPEQPEAFREDPETLLVNGYRSQADLLSVAIQAVIQRALRERVSLILEGVHIHPAFVEKLEGNDEAVVMPVMLGMLKRKQLQQRIRGRGTNVPQRRADRYLQHFDEIWGLQSYLLSEADRTNIPIVINSNRDKAFREIMRITIETLAKDFNNTPEAVFA